MALTLDGQVVKVYRFHDDPEMPWFQAKPIIVYLSYTHITKTLDDHVEVDDKSSLQDLFQSKGLPIGVVYPSTQPLATMTARPSTSMSLLFIR